VSAEATTPTPVRLGYLPGIDGVRALAIATVVGYHAHLGGFDGGFLGVDIFFVISGYLITTLLITEWRSTGRIDFVQFWKRRARRLLPALFALLAVAATLLLTVDRSHARAERGDVVAAVTYISNWYQIATNRSYFDTFARPPLLRHLWSLAVEEQFYVVWPVVMTGALAWVKRRRLLIAIFAVGAAASSLAMVAMYARWVPDPVADDPSSVYLRTDTRAAALLVGAAVAMWFHQTLAKPVAGASWPGRRFRATRTDLVGVGALVCLVAIMAVSNDKSPWLYRGGFLAVSIATAGLLVAVTHPGRQLWRRDTLPFVSSGWLARGRPLTWLGERSYGLYLWHWPLFVKTRPGVDITGVPTALVQVGRIVSALIIAELSFRFIEQPFRRSRQSERSEKTVARTVKRSVLVASIPVTALLLVGLVRTPAVTSELERTLTANAEALAAGKSVTTPSLPATVAPSIATPVPSLPTIAELPLPTGLVTTLTVQETTTTTIAVRYEAFRIQGLAVGDSVMLGAAQGIQTAFDSKVTINAKVSRSFRAGISEVVSAVEAGTVGEVLIVHLGNNGSISEDRFTTFLEQVRTVPLVVLVTVRVPRAKATNESVNVLLRNAAAAYPNIVVADWAAVAEANQPALYRDGVHVRPDFVSLYGDLLSTAVADGCGLTRTPVTTPTTTTTTTTTTTPTATSTIATTTSTTTTTTTSTTTLPLVGPMVGPDGQVPPPTTEAPTVCQRPIGR
jgi:peptidoglycan/LPS O-acetylase OafA/YrhL